MKYLAIIFSIYFLGLNFVPCCDDSESTSPKDKTTITSVAENGHPSDSGIDLCSPFCQCHCCHVHLVDFQPTQINLYNTEISTVIFPHFNGREKHYTNSLLQPPRV